MKERIKSSVKTAYSKFGLKAENLEKLVNILDAKLKVMGTTDETFDNVIKAELEAYEPLMVIMQSEVDSRNRNPQPQPDPIIAPIPQPQPLGLDEETKALLKSIKERQDAQDLKEATATNQASRKAKLEAAEKLMTGATNDYIKSSTLASIEFGDEATPEQIAALATPKYNENFSKAFGSGITPVSTAPKSEAEKIEATKAAAKTVTSVLEKTLGVKPKQKEN